MNETTADLILAALQPYELRKEGDHEWRCNSPLRPGSNSHGFKVTIDGDGGAFYDHVTQDKGSLAELAALLGIQVERKAATPTKRGYKNLAEYAEAHHVPAEMLLKAKWSDVTDVWDGTQHRNRPALTFNTDSGIRYRFIDGEKAYYKSTTGYRACWYGLKRAVALATETGQAIVLCNGEVSTIAAQYRGVAACAVTAGEKTLAKPLLAQFLKAWSGAVYLCFDCDDTGRRTAVGIRDQLVALNPVIIDLGLTDGGDLADFCALYETGSVEELKRRATAVPVLKAEHNKSDLELLADSLQDLRAALNEDDGGLAVLMARIQGELDRMRNQTGTPTVLSFRALADENIAHIEYRRENPQSIVGLRCGIPSLDRAIGGFEPEMYVIYGATSMGKSTLAVSFVREFLKQAPGFIATTESHPGRWMNKLVASMTHIPSDKMETGMLSDLEMKLIRDTYAHLAGMGCHVLKHGAPTVALLRAALLAGIREYGYEWCVIDSASKMDAPGAGAIYDVTRAVSNGLQTLWQELGIPFIVTTQVGRDVSERGAGKKLPLLEDGYGGGVIEQNAGVVLGLYNHQYYVDLGTEQPNEAQFPAETALVRVLKNRWRGDARISAVQLKFVGGAGFYELKREHVNEVIERSIDL